MNNKLMDDMEHLVEHLKKAGLRWEASTTQKAITEIKSLYSEKAKENK